MEGNISTNDEDEEANESIRLENLRDRRQFFVEFDSLCDRLGIISPLGADDNDFDWTALDDRRPVGNGSETINRAGSLSYSEAGHAIDHGGRLKRKHDDVSTIQQFDFDYLHDDPIPLLIDHYQQQPQDSTPLLSWTGFLPDTGPCSSYGLDLDR
jgi:hypothetical protein